MATLPDSGRSKLDVEVSYSSSTNNPGEGLSTAEFVHIRQEQPQQQMGDGQRLGCHQPQVRQASHSTRLTNVPVSVDFDLSVFATKDQHGRLTLYPVLRASAGEAATITSAGLAGEPFSPPMPQQKAAVAVAGDVPGVRGRNNCARAAVAAASALPLVQLPRQLQQPHPLVKTNFGKRPNDVRSGKRGSLQQAYVNHQMCSSQQSQPLLTQQPQQQPPSMLTFQHYQLSGTRENDESSTGCSGSSRSSRSCEGLQPAEPAYRRGTRRTVQSTGSRGTHSPGHQRQTPHCRQEDCRTCTIPRFSSPCDECDRIAATGKAKSRSAARRHADQSGRHQQRCSMLGRFVRKLEALVDIMLDEEAVQTQRQRRPRQHPPSSQAQLAASPASSAVQLVSKTASSTTVSAASALVDAAAPTAAVTVAVAQPKKQKQQPVVVSALPRSNVALPDLKLEYAQLYQRD